MCSLLGGAKGTHLVTTAIEHPAILEPTRVLAAEGLKVTRAGLAGQGLVLAGGHGQARDRPLAEPSP